MAAPHSPKRRLLQSQDRRAAKRTFLTPNNAERGRGRFQASFSIRSQAPLPRRLAPRPRTLCRKARQTWPLDCTGGQLNAANLSPHGGLTAFKAADSSVLPYAPLKLRSDGACLTNSQARTPFSICLPAPHLQLHVIRYTDQRNAINSLHSDRPTKCI